MINVNVDKSSSKCMHLIANVTLLSSESSDSEYPSMSALIPTLCNTTDQ